MSNTSENDQIYDNVMEGQKIMDDLTIDKHVTEEEFQNFMHRVTEVGKCYSVGL